MDIFQIVQDYESKDDINIDKKLVFVNPFIEDESVTCGEMDDIKNQEELYKIDPTISRINTDCKIKGDSNETWACYANDCRQIYNSVISDSRCKSCKKGINPYYYFISNENGQFQVDKYPISLKKFGLIEGQMVVNGYYASVCFCSINMNVSCLFCVVYFFCFLCSVNLLQCVAVVFCVVAFTFLLDRS